ncbi:unnamed protein product, partial [Rotaria sordida]
MDIDNIEENDSSDHSDINLDNDLNSPLDYDNVHSEQDDAKMKLNQRCDILFCSRKTNQISDSVNEAYLKLKEWSNILLQPSHRSKQPDTLSSLDLSMDETVWILQHLRDLFAISSEHEQKRLMTMMPSTWGRDRIAKWFGSTPHQARQSIKLKSDAGIFSSFEDQRGNKPLDNEVQLMVHNFYTSDEVSRETSCKKQVIHPQPSRDPIPLRFLHLTIGETLEQFKTMYPTIKIGRSKFFALRPVWVRERTPHENYRYNLYNLAHHHADFNIQASWTFSASGHGKGPCDGLGAVIKSTATQYLLKGGPYVSFSTAKQFFEWCLQKNDRMVVARPRRTDISNVASNHMPEPNRPIEIRWLPSNIVKNEFEELLKPRWDRFSSKDCISGIRDSHQFDADIDGFISCRHISQSNSTTTHKFQIQPAIQSTISRTLTLSDSNNDLFIIIEDGDDFRLAQMHSFDP